MVISKYYSCWNYHCLPLLLSMAFVDGLQTPNDDKLAYNALWGKLAAEILMQNWDAALEDLNKLKDVIDSSVSATAGFVKACFMLVMPI